MTGNDVNHFMATMVWTLVALAVIWGLTKETR